MKTLLKIYFIVLTFFCLNTSAKAQAVDPADSLELVNLYNSTNGPVWKHHDNWLNGPVSTWYGIDVHSFFGWITAIHLSNNNLDGTLPASFGNAFHYVYEVDLSHNHIKGNLPYWTSVPRFNISSIKLNNNLFSGSVSDSYGFLTYLDTLDLSHNQLTGSFPYGLSSTYLIKADLSNNLFSMFNNNFLTGNFEMLESFKLNNNNFTGAIPVSIGNFPMLKTLNLSNNQFAGPIPSSFENLSLLKELILDNNKLTGDVSFLAALPLDTLDLSGNQFNFSGMNEIVKTFRKKATINQQQHVPVQRSGNVLYVSAGGNLEKNTYGWFRAGSTDTVIIKGDSLFYPAQSGTYSVKVQNAEVKRLIIKSLPFVNTSNMLSEKLQNENVTTNSTISNQKIISYPNPANYILHLQTNNKTRVTITDANGKLKMTLLLNNYAEINVSDYSAGIYFITNKTTGDCSAIIITH
jgi:hypothetical protein